MNKHWSETHGMSDTKLYGVWRTMKQRCDNPNAHKYEHYGGLGVTYCREWARFEPFVEWAMNNGYKPGLQLDRIENDKGYSPDNCRWITHFENQQNRSDNVIIEYQGESHSIGKWAQIKGLPYNVLWARIRELGWPLEKAFTEPVQEVTHGYNTTAITYKGETKTLAQWCKITGMKRQTIQHRLEKGWTPEEAFEKPPEPRFKNSNQSYTFEFNGESLTIAEWSRKLGIAKGTLYRRIVQNKWPIEKALTEPVRVDKRYSKPE